jgi:hypothetical protein
MEFLTLAEGFKITIVTDADGICLHTTHLILKKNLFLKAKGG